MWRLGLTHASYSVLCLALNFCRTAKESGFDVVLIDTSGRMQDNKVCFSFTINFSSHSLLQSLKIPVEAVTCNATGSDAERYEGEADGVSHGN